MMKAESMRILSKWYRLDKRFLNIAKIYHSLFAEKMHFKMIRKIWGFIWCTVKLIAIVCIALVVSAGLFIYFTEPENTTRADRRAIVEDS